MLSPPPHSLRNTTTLRKPCSVFSLPRKHNHLPGGVTPPPAKSCERPPPPRERNHLPPSALTPPPREVMQSTLSPSRDHNRDSYNWFHPLQNSIEEAFENCVVSRKTEEVVETEEVKTPSLDSNVNELDSPSYAGIV
ncbi:hypothetical protein Fmac_021263 [Flemingia macrophylla]|uniref:Uncharacterized protein n=1 Tax=Flemingia macrophylla TaxID=520843 RepID=A0ABD1LWC4_9FABA